ncbi:MAG: SDR family oxidoreductase [Actinobacteria bacterium]|nr:SDR family oxidoreductase [Actinomycetota bacterium]
MSQVLLGKRVLVTGASRGIGAAIALAMAKSGATVIAHYGTFPDGAKKNLGEISDDRKFFIGADLSQPGAGRKLWQDAISMVGAIDVLVNNAGVNIETPFEGDDEAWDKGWQETFQVNVFESANVVRESVKHFLTRGGGIVISLSSWSGQKGSALPTLSAYAASKAAVKAMTQTVASSYAKAGIYAYIISPGIVKTRMADLAAVVRGGEEKMKAALAMGELVPPDEVGELAVFLATGKCRHLTGATIDINGASYVR